VTAARERLGAGRHIETAAAPPDTRIELVQCTTADGATVTGCLRSVPGARTVVHLMHPRQDLTNHGMVPELLERGYAVWTQTPRSVNNDVNLLHEQVLLDAAAGYCFLRDREFEAVVSFGHSGGGTLQAFYHEQAALPVTERLPMTPGGRPVALCTAKMPVPDAAIFMAPHPGQAALMRCSIDPSVLDEADPLSIDPDLSCFEPRNGFVPAPDSSCFSDDFVAAYLEAQSARLRSLDDTARALVASSNEARDRYRTSGDAAERRASLAPRLMTVYRTDADLRYVDLSLERNERPYGSLMGRRPDLTNYGLVGFGRLATAEAWLSTWSPYSSRADFLRCAPAVTVPTLLIELTGDQAAFPADLSRMRATLGSDDLTFATVRGTHFGASLEPGGPSGTQLAAEVVGRWLGDRFEAGRRPCP